MNSLPNVFIRQGTVNVFKAIGHYCLVLCKADTFLVEESYDEVSFKAKSEFWFLVGNSK